MTGFPAGVAIVGAGVISKQYLANLTVYPDLRVIAIADLDVERARAKGERYGIPVTGDLDTVLGLDDVEIVVNLTVPAAHADVARAALKAGKHVYGEKPLVTDRADGEKLLAEAEDAGLRIGCAPDTFLGAGLQSARRAIEAGAIGEPVAATTATMTPGPETWHPNPEFLFAPGAGPLFDLGPYYLTSLVALLGPVGRVASLTRRGHAERVIGSGPNQGTVFPVGVPTHVTALLDFTEGAGAVSTFSFDSAHRRVLFEITGTDGSLAVPNPNTFDGPVKVKVRNDREWRDLPVTGDASGRGMGVLDMARSIRSGASHRASGDLAQHVLEVMTAIEAAGRSDTFVPVTSEVRRPAALPLDWDPYAATL